MGRDRTRRRCAGGADEHRHPRLHELGRVRPGPPGGGGPVRWLADVPGAPATVCAAVPAVLRAVLHAVLRALVRAVLQAGRGGGSGVLPGQRWCARGGNVAEISRRSCRPVRAVLAVPGDGVGCSWRRRPQVRGRRWCRVRLECRGPGGGGGAPPLVDQRESGAQAVAVAVVVAMMTMGRAKLRSSRLGQRSAVAMIPTRTFDPTLEEVVRFANQLVRIRPATPDHRLRPSRALDLGD